MANAFAGLLMRFPVMFVQEPTAPKFVDFQMWPLP
jgi:hypothetical protein